jgi:hypothetical protein
MATDGPTDVVIDTSTLIRACGQNLGKMDVTGEGPIREWPTWEPDFGER